MIAAIEDALITLTADTLGAKVRLVDALPGPLTADNLRELTRTAPSVYFAFLGGRQRQNSGAVHLEAVFGMYVMTAHASGHAERRRGRGSSIGAYEILGVTLPVLHNQRIGDAGTAQLRRLQNLFTLRLEREATAVYAAEFVVPMTLPRQADPSTLADFLTYHATHQVGGPDDPDPVDQVDLPQT